MTIIAYIPPTFVSTLPTAIWSGVDGLPVFPFLPGQSISFDKSPLWETKVKRATSGRERRTQLAPYPLWQFKVEYELLRDRVGTREPAILWEFFNTQAAQFAPWLFVDPSEGGSTVPSNVVTDSLGQPILDSGGNPIFDSGGTSTGTQFAVGDGLTTVFQLTRTINSWVEPVYSVFQPTIWDNGAAAGAHTVANGQVSFTVAPLAGHLLTWSGYFYYGCRFDQDELKLTAFTAYHWMNSGVKFTSLRR